MTITIGNNTIITRSVGEQGLSAYQIAIKNGFVGTEQEWLDSLNGTGGVGSGDMTKAVYDTTNSGVVDNAEKVNNLTIETSVPINAIFTDTVYDDTAIQSAVALNTAKVSYPSTDANKLATIEANATADQTGSEIKTAYEAEVNTNGYTDAEKAKLAGLESSRFKGEFASLVALQTAFPTATSGDYANVDSGVGSDVKRYVYDVSDTSWLLQQGTSVALTDAQIKAQYENNADTNAYTDADKSHISNTNNPHGVTKSHVGLSNADNTSDINKIHTQTTGTIVDADEMSYWDSVGLGLKKLTFANIKATLKTYFDTFYQAVLVSGTNIKTVNGTSVLGSGDLVVGGNTPQDYRISGRLYYTVPLTNNASSTTDTHLWVSPFVVDIDLPIDGFGMWIRNVVTANVSCGIYESDGVNGEPKTLLTSAIIPVTTNGVIVTNTAPITLLANHKYWVATWEDVAVVSYSTDTRDINKLVGTGIHTFFKIGIYSTLPTDLSSMVWTGGAAFPYPTPFVRRA